jgi:hypothetical protein
MGSSSHFCMSLSRTLRQPYAFSLEPRPARNLLGIPYSLMPLSSPPIGKHDARRRSLGGSFSTFNVGHVTQAFVPFDRFGTGQDSPSNPHLTNLSRLHLADAHTALLSERGRRLRSENPLRPSHDRCSGFATLYHAHVAAFEIPCHGTFQHGLPSQSVTSLLFYTACQLCSLHNFRLTLCVLIFSYLETQSPIVISASALCSQVFHCLYLTGIGIFHYRTLQARPRLSVITSRTEIQATYFLQEYSSTWLRARANSRQSLEAVLPPRT